MPEAPSLHVALLLPSLKFGGAERVAVNLARALSALGVTVDMLLMSHQGEFLAEAERYCQVVDLQCDRTYKLPGKLLSYFQMRHPDVLLSSFWKLNLCACLARLLHWRTKVLLWNTRRPARAATVRAGSMR